MAVTSAQFTVDDTPIVALNTADPAAGMRLSVKNNDGAELVYLGPAAVASGDGYILGAGETITVTLEPSEVLFAVSTAASALVSVLRS